MSQHIMIIDDEQEARFSLPLSLEDAGYEVSCAEDGQQAYDLITAGPQPDLLVLDIEMPRMNGLQLLDALAGQQISLPTVVVSGYGDKATIIELLRRGVDDFLDKPFREGDLLQAITAVQAKWARRGPAAELPPSVASSDETVSTSRSTDDAVTAIDGRAWKLICRDQSCEIHLDARIAPSDADALRQDLLARLDAGLRSFSCDLAGVDDLPPILLSVLLRFAELLQKNDLGPLRFAGVGQTLSQFFHITNATEQFHIRLEDIL